MTLTTFGQLNLLGAFCTEPLDNSILLNDDPNLDLFITDWERSRFFTLDIETMGRSSFNEALDPWRGKIRLIQIGLRDGRIAVIDLTKPVKDRFRSVLKSTLANPEQHPVGHNIQFDLSFIQQQLGYECRSPRCTRILSILLWCGIKKYKHSLKDVYFRLFGKELDKEQQKSDWSQPTLSNSQLNYAANDVRVTFECFLELCKRLKTWDDTPDIRGHECRYKLSEIAKVECDVIPAFVEMSLNGQPIDIEYGEKVRQQYQNAIADLYQPVYDTIALPFSANSSKLCKAIALAYGIVLEDRDNNSSTSSATLFQAYCDTKNEAMLRLSLARSLKKSLDCIDALIDSAKQNKGYAKGSYTSLGFTGSGRSTCSGGGKSSLIATNLQNIAGEIEHPLVEKYQLPPVRSIIRTSGLDKRRQKEEGRGVMFTCSEEVLDAARSADHPDNMWLMDLSASHLRFAASNSDDRGLVEVLSLKDPHARVTAKMFQLAGKETSEEYCIANKKSDPEVRYYRAIAKTALYTQFNDGQSWTFKQSLNKAYVDVELEDCEKAQQALCEAFPGYTAYATKLKYQVRHDEIVLDGDKFARFRTHDGRLFHVKVLNKVNRKGDPYEMVKLGEVTSVQLISPEAIVMKKALIDILEFIRDNRQLPIKLNSFTHDDVSGEDYTENKVLARFVYKAIAHYFSEALTVESGLDENDALGYKSILISNYSEK